MINEREYRSTKPLPEDRRNQNVLIPHAVLKSAVRENSSGLDMLLQNSKPILVYGWLQHMAIDYAKSKKRYSMFYYKVAGKRHYVALVKIDFEILANRLKISKSTLEYNIRKLRKDFRLIEPIRRGIYLMGEIKVVRFKTNDDQEKETIQVKWSFDKRTFDRCKRSIRLIDSGVEIG